MSNPIDEVMTEHYVLCDEALEYHGNEFYFESENRIICKGCGNIICRID